MIARAAAQKTTRWLQEIAALEVWGRPCVCDESYPPQDEQEFWQIRARDAPEGRTKGLYGREQSIFK